MAGGRITRPGVTDDEYMLVTCTPDTTTAEFFEFQDEGLDAARANLHPTTSTYLAKVTHQGEHTVRGTSKHIAILVTVDAELAKALQAHGVGRGRTKIAAFLQGLIEADLSAIREQYRVTRAAVESCPVSDDAITLPSVGRGSPARMPSTLKIAQPAIDKIHDEIDLATAKLNPDWSPAAIRETRDLDNHEFKTVLMGEFVPFEMPVNPAIRPLADVLPRRHPLDRPTGAPFFQSETPEPYTADPRLPACATEGCMFTAAANSDYCPPCRSRRSGHGL